MCYSAYASFLTSGSLAAIGGASLAIAPKREKVLAVIPLAFAFQQALEGIQWLYLDRGSVCVWAGYGYSFFALLFWPIFLAFTVYVLDKKRRAIMRWFLLLGAIIALWYLYVLFRSPLVIQSIDKHIFYDPPGIFNYAFQQLLYIFVTCGALLASAVRPIRFLGYLWIFGGIFAVLISSETAASLWCFFAAIISMAVYFVIHFRLIEKMPKSPDKSVYKL